MGCGTIQYVVGGVKLDCCARELGQAVPGAGTPWRSGGSVAKCYAPLSVPDLGWKHLSGWDFNGVIGHYCTCQESRISCHQSTRGRRPVRG
jgi:hypothetical protein